MRESRTPRLYGRDDGPAMTGGIIMNMHMQINTCFKDTMAAADDLIVATEQEVVSCQLSVPFFFGVGWGSLLSQTTQNLAPLITPK